MTELRILRRKNAEDKPYWQSFSYTTDDPNAAVSTALTELNARTDLRDMGGEKAEPIQWECSCLQKKCGACAMVINGRPRLACDSKLAELGEKVTIEPLRKFPVVADLMVDRKAMFDTLQRLKVWAEEGVTISEGSQDDAFEAAGCLQCGCCLEVCPNFYVGGKFAGMAGGLPLARLIAQLDDSSKKEVLKAYRKGVYAGCGKSLACRDICPAGLDIESLMVNSNRAAAWKTLLKFRK
ncbi:2Fe-2S iron-sulfur cluster-binding protein [Ruminococcus sp.]|uniref:2Fe-2S iron-sulfur cluster-binding protein n=1 Tax=Ruminococcus sp. TaxID=41978 RepID=UPI0025FAEF6C|nr:2Fe-2S iron-sulfur cluster-binding protein [Ruminococcus sp.]